MHVTVNAAMSADGKLSSRRREQIQISGADDFARVDRLRGEVDAIVVGVGTVLADDPSLLRYDDAHRESVRGPTASPPARVVVDSNCRTPADAAILDGDRQTYLLTCESRRGATAEEGRTGIASANTNVTFIEAGEDRVDLSGAFSALDAHGVEKLMVEGGGEVIFSLFEADLVDRLTVYVGNKIIGGRDAPTLADGTGFVTEFPELELDALERLDSGVVLEWNVVK
jgi:2,5-diamino-6-(ribosylamino)-4(3H)-pyrimidinone 5'-phosphate reductase